MPVRRGSKPCDKSGKSQAFSAEPFGFEILSIGAVYLI